MQISYKYIACISALFSLSAPLYAMMSKPNSSADASRAVQTAHTEQFQRPAQEHAQQQPKAQQPGLFMPQTTEHVTTQPATYLIDATTLYYMATLAYNMPHILAQHQELERSHETLRKQLLENQERQATMTLHFEQENIRLQSALVAAHREFNAALLEKQQELHKAEVRHAEEITSLSNSIADLRNTLEGNARNTFYICCVLGLVQPQITEDPNEQVPQEDPVPVQENSNH